METGVTLFLEDNFQTGGHVELNAYLYRFDMCYTDECSFCKISEDVEHYLMHCHKYSASRLILFDRLRSLGLEELSVGRFGKSTHISMISNSVTHLWSYTNSAIADIAGNSAPISPVTPRRYRW